MVSITAWPMSVSRCCFETSSCGAVRAHRLVDVRYSNYERLLQEVMSIEQSILLEGYAQFVSKVERRPGLTLDDARHWIMSDLMTHGFQVTGTGKLSLPVLQLQDALIQLVLTGAEGPRCCKPHSVTVSSALLHGRGCLSSWLFVCYLKALYGFEWKRHPLALHSCT